MKTKLIYILGGFILPLIMFTSCSDPNEMALEPDLDRVQQEQTQSLANVQVERMYKATLGTMNNSGVSGTATLTLKGNSLTVEIQASGFEPNMVHPQHIHGFTRDVLNNKRKSSCPPPSADTNNDGEIGIFEGLPFYGPVILPLKDFPTAPNGTVDYMETFTLSDEKLFDLNPLQKRAIVLHGKTVNGDYVASRPVACGEIRVAEAEMP